MAERNWKVKATQLPDCENGLWYITECEIRGVVGLCAPTIEALKALTKPAIQEMIELNGRPNEAEFEVAA